MNNNFWHRLIYGNVSKDFYKENQELLDKTNYLSVKMAYIFSTFMAGILALIAIMYSVVDDTLGVYTLMAVVCGVLAIIVILWLPGHLRWTRFFYLIFEIIIFAVAIAAGTIFSPEDLAVQFFVLLVVLPLLYIERPINSIIVALAASIAFCFATYGVKNGVSYLTQIDLLNAGCCMVICAAFIYYVRNMHLNNIQATMILQERSEMDGLTGVLNKVSTEKACQNYMTLSGEQQNCTLIILDIDEFKKVNDTLGHKQGDKLLKQIGYILKGIFREGDIVGRIGGDEFMILMKNVTDTKIAEAKAERILREISIIFADYSTEKFGASMGIANNNMEGLTFPEMYSKADYALYQAKNQGKGRYIIYSDEDALAKNDLPVMLIVDDSEVSRAVLRTCFDGIYNILEADNGKKALEMMDKYYSRLSVVLLDLEMPVMNGYEVLKYMKKTERLKNIVIMIITAHDKNELLALELGADDLITKPYDPLVVKKRVANAIARK
ncbi:MAG: diguanylate cyclase [Clostridia bacterium]|nr:diguanylate cyclase [Lachnospiraceae bacterium]NCC00520.1 diguanylate cyclase [Clostridia bacterium]NCD02529.1 diguanylate cyclase [Clostridia bacterium]